MTTTTLDAQNPPSAGPTLRLRPRRRSIMRRPVPHSRWPLVVILALGLTATVPTTILAQNATSDSDSSGSSSGSSSSSSNSDSSNLLDQFTYQDEGSDSPNHIYPPDEWIKVQCSDVNECLGWPDSYKEGIGWELETNDCQWCPIEGNSCGAHHQSPIDLDRNVALNSSETYNECIDVHWMAYYESSCSWSELVRLNAFSIERHALKVVQPVEDVLGNDDYRVMCNNNGQGHKFGRIDFSKGYSQWWHLSHMDVHVPSEHTQEGHRFAGEIQLAHFYSMSEVDAGVANQMATVAIFLEAYDDAPDYDVLNKLICQWRKAEEVTRAECGLPSVYDEYPGCYLYRRGYDNTTTPADYDSGEPVSSRHLLRSSSGGTGSGSDSDSAATTPVETTATTPRRTKAQSPLDVLQRNAFKAPHEPHHRVLLNERDVDPMEDFDWDAFIQDVYAKEELAQEESQSHRHLLDYDHVDWFNYFPMIGCKTEYYFRVSGTQTIPPCYAKFDSSGDNGSKGRGNTNHWRIMKDPIRVSNRQILELHRLLKDRIAPIDDPLRACKPDTAAAPDPDGDKNKIYAARPLQSTHKAHFEVFCECRDWKSKWLEDQAWCLLEEDERLFDHPYNYDNTGF